MTEAMITPETDEQYRARRRAEAEQRVAEWNAFSARVAAAGEPKTVMIGDPAHRKPYYSIGLLLMDDGWHVRRDYGYPNGGGGGPFGREAYPTRDDALVSEARQLLDGLARDAATGRTGAEAYPATWAQWAINLVPLDLFGGADLASEYAEMIAKYRVRNELRCAAIRAANDMGGSLSKATYHDEEGRERSVYSL
ncbi:hypothetical protein ACIPPQ_20250 [Sphingopyxis sp. LARHCG72]